MTDLTARLTEFIKAEGIEGNYPPDRVAARALAQVHPSHIERWLAEGSEYLRNLCARIKDEEDMTAAELAAEDHYHGHGGRPSKRRSA